MLNALAVSLAITCCQDPGNTEIVNQQEATWESLHQRQSPDWFGKAKFGIFIHWGVYSVPAFCDTSTYSEWYQWWYDTNSHGGKVRDFHHANYGKDFPYESFSPMFRAEMWDPDEWASIFQRSGAKYMVITSKHHDGFCLWPNETASEVRGYPWNSMETGPKRDLLGDLFDACRRHDVRPGLYYSFMEWHNPLYDDDKPRYVDEVMIPQIKELITTYEPEVFWPDGEWDHPDKLWRSTEILEWIHENSPSDQIVVNDRWGKGLRGQTGDFSTTEYGSLGNSSGMGMQKTRPFEECRGIGHSFAFNRAEGYDIYSSRTECIHMLIDLVSKGGNLLLDIGPTADGRIPLIMVDRLLAIGDWLEVNGESIYETTAGPQGGNLPWGRMTSRGNDLYLHVFEWPEDDQLVVEGLVTPITSARMLGDRVADRTLVVDGNSIDLSGLHPFPHATVIRLEFEELPVIDRSIQPDARGMLTLDPGSARLSGPNLRVEQYPDTDGKSVPSLGYWNATDATATWTVRLEPGTTYEIELDHACAEGEEGGVLELTLGGKTWTFPIKDHTGDWGAFRLTEIGTLVAPESEPTELMLRADSIGGAGNGLLNLRTLRLVPVSQ
jgi:alpha-L-fucosidase